jgi:hypothetical protein
MTPTPTPQPDQLSPPPEGAWATLWAWGTTTATVRPVPNCWPTARFVFGVVGLWRPRLTTSRRLRRSRLASGSGNTFRAAARAMLLAAAGWLRNARSRNL